MDDDKNIIINNIIKNKVGRPARLVKYADERKIILQTLYDILEVTDNNKIFYFNDVDDDPIKKQKMENLIIDVKKYFNCKGWHYFANRNAKHVIDSYAPLIRAILKDMDIKTTCAYLTDWKEKKHLKKGLQIN